MRDPMKILASAKKGGSAFSRKLNEQFQASSSSNKYKDERVWALTRDSDSGRGEAVIRFLPNPDEDQLPYVKYYEHFVNGDDGRWLIVKACPRSFGKSCPICERASKYYRANMQERYKKAKAKQTYVFNILVVDDKADPQNNGKVFMFKAGPTIFNMIMESIESEFDDEQKRPFGIYDGHNFIYRSRKDPTKGGQITYDKSKFEDTETPIAKTDDEIVDILNKCYELDKYVNDMASQMDVVEIEEKAKNAFRDDDPGSNSFGKSAVQSMNIPMADEDESVPFSAAGSNVGHSAPKSKPVKAFSKKEAPEAEESGKRVQAPEEAPSLGGDEDDDISFFRNIVES